MAYEMNKWHCGCIEIFVAVQERIYFVPILNKSYDRISLELLLHIPRNLRNRSNGTERCSALI